MPRATTGHAAALPSPAINARRHHPSPDHEDASLAHLEGRRGARCSPNAPQTPTNDSGLVFEPEGHWQP